jgi:hypothetical protein
MLTSRECVSMSFFRSKVAFINEDSKNILLFGEESFLICKQSLSQSRNSLPFMAPKISVLCTYINPVLILIPNIFLCLDFPSDLSFPSHFQTKICRPLSSMCATYPTNLIFLEMITLIISGG